MSLWIEIQHAPKDRAIDVWAGARIADAEWHTCAQGYGSGVDWCVWNDEFGEWRAVRVIMGCEVTHYMEIPKGPNT